MSVGEPLSPGTELSTYRLVEKIGGFVWRATDGRGGKDVAIKVLTRQLPSDPERRDEVFKHVRVRAALYQPFLVPILDVVVAGDTLLLVMDLVRGEPLRQFLGGQPRPAAEVFRIAVQVADAVKFLQLREMVHGNVNGDSVIVGPDGHVRLGGLNLTNIMRRKEGAVSPAYQQKGSDLRCVAYMAPEQIAEQPVDFRVDVFSLGVLMYEAATGVLPWSGTTAAEVARSIVEGQPRSPRVIRPEVDAVLVDTIARCIARDPFQRHKDMRTALEELVNVAPDAAGFASDVVVRMNTPATGASAPAARRSMLLLADVDVEDPQARAAIVAKMQQIVGEAAYLFDGRVVDPFSGRLVAEMPTIEAAVEAGRKAEFDLIAAELEGEELPIRLLLHSGDLEIRDGSAAGVAVDRGFGALVGAPQRQLFISEEFVRQGRGALRLHDAGARGGMKLFEIAPAEERDAAPEAAPLADSISTAELPPLPAPGAKKRRRAAAATIGLVLLIAGVAGIDYSRRHARTRVVSAPVAPVVRGPREVVIEPFSVEGAEPAMIERANAIRLAAIELLRETPNLRVVDVATPVSGRFGASIRTDSVPPQFIPTASAAQGKAVPLVDDAAGVRAFVDYVARQSGVRVAPATPVALNAFTQVLAAKENGDAAGTEAALRAALAAAPGFLPIQLEAMEFYSRQGNDEAAVAAATQVLQLSPAQPAAARIVARASLAHGDVPNALQAYAALLKSSPNDVEALTAIGRYAWSAGDARRFNAALARLTLIAPREVSLHAPDLLLAAGRFDDAVQKYYDIEVETPNNAALALKIGRVAVLRHTAEIAKLELDKLQSSDPAYGYHLLKAYIAASANRRGEAQSELALALEASRPGDTYWTSAAEVHAILGDSKQVVAALRTAAERWEPSIAYVLADPLFDYLASDGGMQRVRATLIERQAEIRAALAKIAI